MKQLTHGSLFAGIGGFDIGFERAGIKTVWQVEIDPFCRKVLEKHWPNVQRFSDIRECRELPAVDVVSGGFPCQDISTAGAGRGLDGERSGLWREYHRIIGQLRPQFAVVENVAELLNRGMGIVLGSLADIGYDAEWEMLPACAFGAPHIRERVWIVAYPNANSERCVFRAMPAEKGGGKGDKPLHRIARLATDAWRNNSEPGMAGMVDGIPDYVDRYAHLGNAVVPQIAEWIGRRIVAFSEAGERVGGSRESSSSTKL